MGGFLFICFCLFVIVCWSIGQLWVFFVYLFLFVCFALAWPHLLNLRHLLELFLIQTLGTLSRSQSTAGTSPKLSWPHPQMGSSQSPSPGDNLTRVTHQLLKPTIFTALLHGRNSPGSSPGSSAITGAPYS